MSNQNQQSPEPGCGHVFLSLIGAFVVFALFSLIVCFAYFPTKQDDDDAKAAKARKDYRLELEAKQHVDATTYGWVNQTDGVVRIPIKRAMELTVNELSANQEGRPSK